MRKPRIRQVRPETDPELWRLLQPPTPETETRTEYLKRVREAVGIPAGARQANKR